MQRNGYFEATLHYHLNPNNLTGKSETFGIHDTIVGVNFFDTQGPRLPEPPGSFQIYCKAGAVPPRTCYTPE